MAEITVSRARWILYIFAFLGLSNTWGRAAIDGTLTLLFRALHSSEPCNLPGTNSLPRTTIRGIRWPLDYLLNVLVLFFWQAVNGSHPTTSVIGIYFLGQYFGVLTSFYVNSWRLANSRRWSIAPLPWLLVFQLMGAAVAGPWYALVYLTSSPIFSKQEIRQKSSGFLVSPISTLFLPISLFAGYVLPAVLMALPSPSVVTNDFQQMAVVAWNLFPMILTIVQAILSTSGAMLGFVRGASHPSPEQHIRGTRMAYVCSLIVTLWTHIAIISLSVTTALFPFLFRSEYVLALSPKSLALPSISAAPVASLGEGVRTFFLWDQVFTYSTMLLLLYVQFVQVKPLVIEKLGSTRLFVFLIGSVVLLGPGSTCVMLSWAVDETWFLQSLAPTLQAVKSDREQKKDSSLCTQTRKF